MIYFRNTFKMPEIAARTYRFLFVNNVGIVSDCFINHCPPYYNDVGLKLFDGFDECVKIAIT